MDMVLFAAAHVGAYFIRFDFNISPLQLENMAIVMPWLIAFKVTVFYLMGIYRGMYRYSGISDMWRIVKATILSSLAIITIMLILQRFSGFSRAVFILDGGLSFLFTGGLRLGIRIAFQEGFLGNKNESHALIEIRKGDRPLIIIGAGDAGEKTLRELGDNSSLPYKVVGFLDDDIKKKGRSIHGVSVLGRIDELEIEAKRFGIEEVLIAVPSATGEQMREIITRCDAAKIKYRTLPGLGELIDGKVSIKALRDVDFQDLLGRPAVHLDETGIENYLKGNVVMVTGAGGSIGSELCRQIVRFNPEKIILFDADEEALYGISVELKQRIPYGKYVTVLGGIQNKILVRQVIEKYKPHVVFHAAAYKHVPLIEGNPWQAVFNNILGSLTVVEQCFESKVGLFVLVSTDKAVRPTNVMGVSKRMCELILKAFYGNGTRMMAVRFGNVVGSSGSVIPLFREQIRRGGPITVTHPEVTRYFMTIPEASQLILQAGALGEGGEIFILEMGTPVKIADMARDLIRLSGKEPNRDIEIIYTGLRPGEKLYEELITEGEGIVPTEHDKIMMIPPNGSWNGFADQKSYRNWLMIAIKELKQLAEKQDGRGIREKFQEIVPEYMPGDTECVL